MHIWKNGAGDFWKARNKMTGKNKMMEEHVLKGNDMALNIEDQVKHYDYVCQAYLILNICDKEISEKDFLSYFKEKADKEILKSIFEMRHKLWEGEYESRK